jgi:MFS family permease
MNATAMKATTPPHGYRSLLRGNRSLRLLWLGQAVSLLGDWISYVSVLGLVMKLNGSGWALAITMLARALPYTLVGLASGAVIDRWDRRKLLIAADVARGLIALGYLAVRSPDTVWLVYILGALMQSFSALFNPGLQAAIPSVARPEERIAANSLLQGTNGAAMVLGSALGGLVGARLGYDWAFLLNAASFFASAACLLAVPCSAEASPRPSSTPWDELRDGFHFIRYNPSVLAVILRRMGERLGAGFNLLLSLYAVQVWHQGDSGIGSLYAVIGLGLMAGSWAAGRLGRRADHRRLVWIIGWGGAAEALFWIAFALSPNLAAGSAMIAGMVAGDITAAITEVTLLQQLVPDRFRGRVFAARETLQTVAWAVSLPLTGTAAERFGPRPAALGIGLILMIIGIGWMLFASRSRVRSLYHATGGNGDER